ncbi:enoyl-CoA hydratase/isomerase family protein [Syntrophomonas wolfei]|jgi:enoyl-CoA hydratase|uniref:enoyl-CoA hydratase/isomerase family protein n=1 Tax=Syntrophomonas wolfei TaxID=863 RepID=UPI0023F33F32|nr:enoyl-CoA hydratase/isomerase family protein [Syntrophomonas wolfei]
MSDRKLDLLTLDITDSIATVTLHAPPVNALSQLMLDEISSCFFNLSQNKLKVVVLTGNMNCGFSAGANIRELVSQNPQGNRQFFANLYQLFNQLEDIPFPLIVPINRFAMGAGLELALCADIRVMDDNARVAAAGVNMGLVFGTQRLSRLVGLGQAKNMVLTGRQITAHEAYDIGLVQYLSPPGQALNQAWKLAELIAQKSSLSVLGAKKVLNAGFDIPLDKGLHLEFEQLEKMLASEDFQQCTRAFLNKTAKL